MSGSSSRSLGVSTSPLTKKRLGFPHIGHPSTKYLTNWSVQQSASGWLSLGNYFGHSAVFITKIKADPIPQSFDTLQPAFHVNICSVIEAFLDKSSIYMVYGYYGIIVDLAQVGTSPAVRLTEPDLASICRSVLNGLQYIHSQLGVGHGNITRSNILLCENGDIKIANVGTSMLDQVPLSEMEADCRNVGNLLIEMSDPKAILDPLRRKIPANLSKYGQHFVTQVGSSSYSYIFEHAFLQQASPDHRMWHLIPHYWDTLAHWGPIIRSTGNEFR
ncbi:uncharacterized protein N7506_000059 [Penicillium brevicompactum]|uniref:uncharacterized protein n=1 Tax=Penicillium brevicompactum TaxID=5074 RepID=UPI00253FBACA|nr:uncharacterized protein N7506_000059 [Penicillium brevicompactum]KAJ5346806.1 hypothetical protein N7506_000059 [Penicillium brevicompactum]